MKLQFALITLGLPVCLACANPPKTKPRTIAPLHNAEVSILLNSFDYKEDFPPPGKSTENGWLFGVALRYTFEGGSDLPLYGRVHFDFSPSSTEYGSTETDAFGRSTDFTETTQNWFSRFECDAGYVFHGIGNSSIDVIPYTGYGYRFWRRDLSGHNDLMGYTEDYSWSYLPIGVKGELRIGRYWLVGLDMALRVILSGNIYIRLEQYDNPTLTLGNLPGWYVAAPVEYRTASGWGAGVTFWYEYSAIDRSNDSPHVILGGQEAWIYEPASRTHQFGFMFTGLYSF